MSDLLGRLRVLSRALVKTFVGEMLDEAANEIERLQIVIANAYQAAAAILDAAGSFEKPHSQKLLDYLASEGEGEPPLNGDLVREIERLRQNVGCARHQRTTQFCAEAVERSTQLNAAYDERNRLVALLAGLFPSGIKKTAIPGWDEEWHGCVYIDFPFGQASWHYHESQAHLFDHLPPYQGEWDGHTTEEKYRRIGEAAKSRRVALDTPQRGWNEAVEAAAAIVTEARMGERDGDLRSIIHGILRLRREEE